MDTITRVGATDLLLSYFLGTDRQTGSQITSGAVLSCNFCVPRCLSEHNHNHLGYAYSTVHGISLSE